MGSKKHAKGRLDKYYHMAKEQGYRARSAFKLIQLNKKYGFLNDAKVLVDLCAAPGGWCQVAQKTMPKDALIIGLDLVPIKPIPNVITHCEDITSSRCRATLKAELKHFKVDVVLHDGAPNVGINWIQDAFTQAELTLSALKLATEFLNEQGTFVTKVFRSKDYNKLIWVFHQLFKTVTATKPSSSRNVSAEIFVVCQGFLAPKKIDPKLLDAKHVFRELDDVDGDQRSVKEQQGAVLNDLLHPEKRKRHRDGYDTTSLLVNTTSPVSEFITSHTYLDILSRCNALVFEKDDDLANHMLTTPEIKDNLADLRLLGKKEFKAVIRWREAMRLSLGLVKPKKTEESESEDEETLEDVIDREEDSLKALLKRTKRKTREKKAKNLLRLNLGMNTPADIGIDAGLDMGTMPEIAEEGMEMEVDLNSSDDDEVKQVSDMDDDLDSDEELEHKLSHLESQVDSMYEHYKTRQIERNPSLKVKKVKEGAGQQFEEWYGVSYEKHKDDREADSSDDSDDDRVDPVPIENDDEDDMPVSKPKKNKSKKSVPESDGDDMPVTKKPKTKMTTDAKLFFDNPIFKMMSTPATPSKKVESESEGEDNQREFETVAFEEEEEEIPVGSNPIPEEKPDGLPIIDSATSYVLAQQLVTQKGKRDLIDDAFNRNTFNDPEGLPEWFQQDEKRHKSSNVPVTKEAVELMRQRYKALDARPIKKVAEAKFRKQMRTQKRMDKAAKKADGLIENEDDELNDKTRLEAVAKVMNQAKAKAGKAERREKPKLVVAKGANKGVKGRPKGIKGRYKIVDSRGKKDLRAEKRTAKKNKPKRRK